jgi:hypothetical protein
MIESLLTVITLGILFLIFVHRGKTPPQGNRLLINRPGSYQIMLAPKLNLAQPFIEAVAERIDSLGVALHSSAMLFLSVRNRHVVSYGTDNYLLAIFCRNGLLYFQAEYPSKKQCDNLDILKAFSIESLLDLPARDEYSEILEVDIVSAVQAVAQERGINVSLLTE